MKSYRKAQAIIKARREISRVRNRWRKYGCSCGKHNMRGNK
ncbi:hypothetical protein SEA_PHREDRICK_207 [Streptomyces phage Phredrick]|uniref:Uncharacterized protein n=1 Tax=Streptomyces phage MeganTheeKilla TaxID=2801897 RepID=A0A7U0GCB0_9CAUD|nr:hypothetical protein SEA_MEGANTHEEKILLA_206 [Streptomyces phage MeganTheeKilla]WMI33570.1 hypothetical protein SEA_KENREY_208 [Streptomyces phage Kenrey]WNN94761.1 hypothetical protein SEA_PHREDRICK_207 [Streptomyces phage Phredrick]